MNALAVVAQVEDAVTMDRQQLPLIEAELIEPHHVSDGNGPRHLLRSSNGLANIQEHLELLTASVPLAGWEASGKFLASTERLVRHFPSLELTARTLECSSGVS